jgi:DNA-binding MarR family transcriptional regulator
MKTKLVGTSPRYRALLQLLRTADTLWDASRAFFSRWDLGPSQFNVLNLLDSAPAGLSQTELSRQLIMHRSNVTGLVDRLVRRGLVERLDVAGDRRAYRVVLTPAGADLIREILPRYYDQAERVWGNLSARRVSELSGDLQLAAQNAEHIVTKTEGQEHENIAK